MNLLRLNLCIVLCWISVNPVFAITISQVSHNKNIFNPVKNESVDIRFRLSEAAVVTLSFYDDRELLIRRITSKNQLKEGAHTLSWDGRDQKGEAVPPEAYRYTIKARNSEGKEIEFDLSDLTGGDSLEVKKITWDPKSKKISYLIPEMARINTRVGLKARGPLLITLQNWVPRTSGRHSISWNGKDVSGVIDLGKHPNRQIDVQAFSLSDNTILIGPLQNQSTYVKNINKDTEKRTKKKTRKKRMFNHSQQTVDQRGDFPVLLTIPEDIKKNKDGIPIVDGKTPFRVDVAKPYWGKVFSQRFETVFYLDGQFIEESELGILPLTWYLKMTDITPGIHYITTNVRSYEGNFGTSSIKIYVPEIKKTETENKKGTQL